MRTYYVYILSNRSRRLYVGVTKDLLVRLAQHRNGECEFTARYGINRLVYYEMTQNIMGAISREKQLKSWRRSKKLTLIASMNPGWDDLSEPWLEKSGSTDPSLRSG